MSKGGWTLVLDPSGTFPLMLVLWVSDLFVMPTEGSIPFRNAHSCPYLCAGRMCPLAGYSCNAMFGLQARQLVKGVYVRALRRAETPEILYATTYRLDLVSRSCNIRTRKWRGVLVLIVS
jgi:hypothetical protein